MPTQEDIRDAKPDPDHADHDADPASRVTENDSADTQCKKRRVGECCEDTEGNGQQLSYFHSDSTTIASRSPLIRQRSRFPQCFYLFGTVRIRSSGGPPSATTVTGIRAIFTRAARSCARSTIQSDVA
jgi:hypothetical protein